MKLKKISFLFLLVMIGCKTPTQFSDSSLQEKFTNTNLEEQTFESILSKHSGKKILINIWASWCRDCIVGLPHFKKLQQENPEVVFVNLSLDKSLVKWKQALDRYQIRADHYYLSQGKKGDFGKFINLWWIPRYMVVNETGDIILYKATKITDKKIVEALKN